MKVPTIEDALAEGEARVLLQVALAEAKRRDRTDLFGALLFLSRVCRVAFSDDAKTARLRLKCGEFRIEFGRAFIAQHVKTPTDLLHLLLHEVLHRIRGDLRRPLPEDVPEAAAKSLSNFAADLLVNAEIQSTLLGTTGEYFRGLYPKDRFPMNLLLPPWMLVGPGDENIEGRCAEAFKGADADPARVVRVYLSAWAGEPSYGGLLRALHELLPVPPEEAEQEVLWLGDHGGDEGEEWRWLDERLRERMRREGRLKAGYGEEVEEQETEEEPVERKQQPFYEAVRRALVDDPACPRVRPVLSTDRSVVPFIGRRESFLLAGGWWPTLFRSTMPSVDEDERRVHVYIDVSGSTRMVLPRVYGLVLHLRDEIGDRVWLFSNAVREAKMEELRRGHVRTTGGTDFDCVAEHALENRYRRILIITDGDGPLDGALERRLRARQVGLFVVLTADNPGSPVLSLARQHWQISGEGLLPF